MVKCIFFPKVTVRALDCRYKSVPPQSGRALGPAVLLQHSSCPWSLLNSRQNQLALFKIRCDGKVN